MKNYHIICKNQIHPHIIPITNSLYTEAMLFFPSLGGPFSSVSGATTGVTALGTSHCFWLSGWITKQKTNSHYQKSLPWSKMVVFFLFSPAHSVNWINFELKKSSLILKSKCLKNTERNLQYFWILCSFSLQLNGLSSRSFHPTEITSFEKSVLIIPYAYPWYTWKPVFSDYLKQE